MSRHRPSWALRGLLGGAALCLLAAAYGARAAWSAGASSLDQAVERICGTEGRRQARIRVYVADAATGGVLYSRLGSEAMIPASNEKLVTAVAALEVLGRDYQFETLLLARGTRNGDSLDGDLILRGSGDPTIGGRYEDETAEDIFRRWADEVKALGIARVTGDVVADDALFDRQWYHPHWSPEQAWKWYFAPTSAVAINDGCVTVTVRPGPSTGSKAIVALTPPSAPVGLLNVCKTSSRRQAVWFERSAGQERIKVGGLVRSDSKGYSQPVTVPQPSLYAAAVMQQVLQEEGIAVGGRARLIEARDVPQIGSAVALCSRRTDLLPVLETMLRRSHNHYAEQVFKAIGARAAGRGSWKTGGEGAARLLTGLGFDEEEFVLDDGSGLSRQNRLSAEQLTGLLVRVGRSGLGERFVSMLAGPGEGGTLHSRLAEPPYRDTVRAKTGYLDGVGALSGYATTRSGRRVAFSILVNDDVNPPGTYSMRETVDGICRAIVDCVE